MGLPFIGAVLKILGNGVTDIALLLFTLIIGVVSRLFRVIEEATRLTLTITLTLTTNSQYIYYQAQNINKFYDGKVVLVTGSSSGKISVWDCCYTSRHAMGW